MNALPGQQISPHPPQDIAQNFSDLLQVGIKAAQRLSQDHWTDFNEHDPGVTILEALTYALTDLSYRIDHPIADIIASSMAENGTALADQPLFTGDRILTGAPHTAHDFRKLAYDRVRGLRDMWILPSPADMPGVHRVLVHPFPDAVGERAEPSKDEILTKVAGILFDHRPMGEDFLWPEIAPLRELAISAQITISSEATPETVLADILFRIEQRINPAPELREIGRDMEAGVPPDAIFDGPRLNLGWIPGETLPPFGQLPRSDAIADTILRTKWVSDLGAFDLIDIDRSGVPHEGRYLSTLARRPEALDHVTILRDGVPQDFDATRVLAFLSHKEESARWAAGYASHRTDALTYAQVPLGNPDRALSRYRSLQHLFPPAYRLGHDGTAEKTPRKEHETSGATEPDHHNPTAQRMQLKAYLLFFEQILANALAQLSHTAERFSFAPDQSDTYFTKPLRPEGRETPDSPPDIADLLGAVNDADWWVEYCKRLQVLAAQADPVPARLHAMRDAMLARFGAALPGQRLQQLWDRDRKHPEQFQTFLAEQKRQRLASIVTSDGARGIGANPMAPATPERPDTAAIDIIRNLTGHNGLIQPLDHVLLRPPGTLDGIGHMTIATDFEIAAKAPYWAARLSRNTVALHLISDTDAPYRAWLSLAEQVIATGSDPAHLHFSDAGGYRTHLRLDNGQGGAFHLLETLSSRPQARRISQWIVDLADDLRHNRVEISSVMHPVELPVAFYERQLSIILAPGRNTPDGPEYQAFVNRTLRDRLPAHLRHICYWVTREQGATIEADATTWHNTMAACRTARTPGANCLHRLDTTAANLRAHIQSLFVAQLRRSKANWFRGAPS